MAVAVDSVVPANGATAVAPNYPVTVEMSDSSAMDSALVEIIVNGVSHTIANGGLDLWDDTTWSGSAVVADYLDLVYQTTFDWYKLSGATVTITVKYSAATISTTTFTAEDWDVAAFPHAQGDAYYFHLTTLDPISAKADAYYVVSKPVYGVTDAYYYVAIPISTESKLSVIVGVPTGTVVPGSTVVQGYRGTIAPTSVVVQGPTSAKIPTTAIVGVVWEYKTQISNIVGVETIQKIPASAVTLPVYRNGVVHIKVQDATTKTLLESLGITFSYS